MPVATLLALMFFKDNFVNFMSVMKSAVAKFGVQKLFNFANGSSYKNKQMDLLAARIGSTVHYDQPYKPTQKAKIKRLFNTVEDQRMADLDMRDFHTLDELCGGLHTYVSQYNQKTHFSVNEKVRKNVTLVKRTIFIVYRKIRSISYSYWS